MAFLIIHYTSGVSIASQIKSSSNFPADCSLFQFFLHTSCLTLQLSFNITKVQLPDLQKGDTTLFDRLFEGVSKESHKTLQL